VVIGRVVFESCRHCRIDTAEQEVVKAATSSFFRSSFGPKDIFGIFSRSCFSLIFP
jgi:hypothetical protein